MKKTILFLLFLLISCTQTNYVLIGDLKIPVEIADTPEKHAKGLMFREELQGGMLFIFEQEQPLTFWMKNTKLPLDIIFIDKDLTIIDFKENFQPCTSEHCETFTSKSAKYALELNAGFIKQNKVRLGKKIKII